MLSHSSNSTSLTHSNMTALNQLVSCSSWPLILAEPKKDTTSRGRWRQRGGWKQLVTQILTSSFFLRDWCSYTSKRLLNFTYYLQAYTTLFEFVVSPEMDELFEKAIQHYRTFYKHVRRITWKFWMKFTFVRIHQKQSFSCWNSARTKNFDWA